MNATTHTAGILGIEGYIITVTASVELGHPCLVIAEQDTQYSSALSETRERVRAALARCGHPLPPRQQIISLAPAEQRKNSPGCDLAVACALLVAHEVIPADALASTLLWGELAFDGELRPATGVLVVADSARQQGFRRIIVSEASARDAARIPGIEVVAARDLASLAAQLRGELPLAVVEPETSSSASYPSSEQVPDLTDVRGLALPRLALEVMVAGGHNLLLHGPPGLGKTMLARRIPGLFPPLEHDDALEVTKIHGVARRQIPDGLISTPPVRMPHHTVSVAGLLGGGNPPRPGEVSLAHRGVLFLDELPEFPGACFEGLREPLEDRVVSIVRARYAMHYPARFQLMAAMNPCPCGFLGHPERVCTDSPAAVQRYQGRVAKLMRYFDLAVPVTPLTRADRAMKPETSATVRERIIVARARQQERLEELPWDRNADIPVGMPLDRLCAMTPDAEALFGELRASTGDARAHRILAVARTIADLDVGREPGKIQGGDMIEAGNLWAPPEHAGEAQCSS